jgi:hypothetical protein
VTLRPLIALAMVALTIVGCSNTPEETGSSTPAATREAAVTFSACMRENGVEEFPDPDASGELTIDAIANGTSIDTSSPVFDQALEACKDLTPSGFTGRERTAGEQDAALQFAQCMRDNGIKDFPDPVKGAPIIDTTRIPSAKGRGALDIPGFTAATETCSDRHGDDLGIKRP